MQGVDMGVMPDVEFVKVSTYRIADVPTGRLMIVPVPGSGKMGVYAPKAGRKMIFVEAGKFRKLAEITKALVNEYRTFVGLDDIHSYA